MNDYYYGYHLDASIDKAKELMPHAFMMPCGTAVLMCAENTDDGDFDGIAVYVADAQAPVQRHVARRGDSIFCPCDGPHTIFAWPAWETKIVEFVREITHEN